MASRVKPELVIWFERGSSEAFLISCQKCGVEVVKNWPTRGVAGGIICDHCGSYVFHVRRVPYTFHPKSKDL